VTKFIHKRTNLSWDFIQRTKFIKDEELAVMRNLDCYAKQNGFWFVEFADRYLFVYCQCVKVRDREKERNWERERNSEIAQVMSADDWLRKLWTHSLYFFSLCFTLMTEAMLCQMISCITCIPCPVVYLIRTGSLFFDLLLFPVWIVSRLQHLLCFEGKINVRI
jgi:hypothetical protein